MRGAHPGSVSKINQSTPVGDLLQRAQCGEQISNQTFAYISQQPQLQGFVALWNGFQGSEHSKIDANGTKNHIYLAQLHVYQVVKCCSYISNKHEQGNVACNTVEANGYYGMVLGLASWLNFARLSTNFCLHRICYAKDNKDSRCTTSNSVVIGSLYIYAKSPLSTQMSCTTLTHDMLSIHMAVTIVPDIHVHARADFKSATPVIVHWGEKKLKAGKIKFTIQKLLFFIVMCAPTYNSSM